MDELDSLHCIFLIATNINLNLKPPFLIKKQKLKNQQIFEQEVLSLVKKHQP